MSEESKNLENIPESEINNEETPAKQKAEEEEAARVAEEAAAKQKAEEEEAAKQKAEEEEAARVAEEAAAKQKAEEEALSVAKQVENIEIKIKDVSDIIEEPEKIEVEQKPPVFIIPSTPAPPIRNVARRRPKVGMIMRR